jgi:dihydroorotate dehydrogenase
MSTVLRLGQSLLMRLPPEDAHDTTLNLLQAGVGVPTRPPAACRDPRLRVHLPVSGLTLPNPIGLAAGFDKDARVFSAMARFGFGFTESGTVTPRPQAGNPKPRLFRLSEDNAVINRMGFNNGGLAAFATRFAERNAYDSAADAPAGANVGANKDSTDRIADYVTGLRAVWPHADFITLNISSPNTPGLRGLQDRGALEELLGRTGEAALALTAKGRRVPLFLKVAPDLDDAAIADLVAVALAAPCLQGLIVSNTTLSRPDTLRSTHRAETGGLSGAPLMALSTQVLGAFAQAVGDRLDLIGAGGIRTPQDVAAKLAAGAKAVQLYSALVYEGPGLVERLCRALLPSGEQR